MEEGSISREEMIRVIDHCIECASKGDNINRVLDDGKKVVRCNACIYHSMKRLKVRRDKKEMHERA